MEKLELSLVSIIFVLFTLFMMYTPIDSIYRDVIYAMYSWYITPSNDEKNNNLVLLNYYLF